MQILVVWASQHGATREIGERIGARLRAAGHTVDLRSVTTTPDVWGYDAFVVGSAVYMGRWRKEAMAFVRERRESLAARPTWLYSSGPLVDPVDPELRAAAERKEIEELLSAKELAETVHPRDHKAFFGAMRPDRLSFPEKVMRATPVGRKIMPEGDFRDWAEIEAWADGIAADLSNASTAEGPGPAATTDGSRPDA